MVEWEIRKLIGEEGRDGRLHDREAYGSMWQAVPGKK
jgi:hypothetical protein